ncbi:hypothetical protein GCM10027589_44470 [Actinocorallia lasiicapitis]
MVLVIAALAAAAPRLVQARVDAAARDAVAGTTLEFAGTPTAFYDAASGKTFREGPAGAAQVEEVARQLRDGAGRDLSSLFGAESHNVRSGRIRIGAVPSVKALAWAWDPVAFGAVDYRSGRAPASRPDLLEFALVGQAASVLELKVGAKVALPAPGGRTVQARLSGIYEIRPGALWETRTELTRTMLIGGASDPISLASGLVDDQGLAALRSSDLSLSYTWRFELHAERLTAGQASRIPGAIEETRGFLEGVQPGQMQTLLVTRLQDRLAAYLGELRVSQTVLALALGGLAATAAGVLIMACRLLLDRLRTPLATMRARGASLPQLGLLVLGTAGPIVIVAGLAGYGLGSLAEGPSTTASLFGPLAIVLVALVVPPVTAMIVHRGTGREERQGLGGGGLSPRRLVLECLAVVLAAAGVVALRGRGLTTDAAARGTDPFLALVPVLLVIASGLVVLRLYPYPLRLVGLAARRSKSTVLFLGISTAARQRVSTALPLLVLLLATSSAAFASTVDSGLRDAQRRVAAHTTGADTLLINESFPTGVEEALRKVPGVERVTPVRVAAGRLTGGDGVPVTVTIVLVDLDDYRRTAEGLALDLPAAPQAGGALLGPGLLPGKLEQDGTPLEITIRDDGKMAAFPGVTVPTALVVVPYHAFTADNPFPNQMYVRGVARDPAALRKAAFDNPNLTVLDYTRVHADLTGSQLVELVHLAFASGGVAVGVCALLAVLLALITSAAARGRTIGYLATLGLTRRQARGLTLTELGPLVAVATLAGWAVGLALPHLLGQGLDLTPFTGGHEVGAPGPDLTAALLLLGGVTAVTALAVAVDGALAARRGLDNTLRVGEQ